MGESNGTHDDERRAAIEAARATFAELHESCEGLAVLVDVIEEVGEAVIAAAADGAGGAEQFDAGREALEPHGDENDGLRTGLRWFVAACSGDDDELEDAPPPKPRRKGKKTRSGR